MADVEVRKLTAAKARSLTDKINAGVGELADLIYAAREGEAWRVLGYETWSAYVDAEFKVSRGQAWRLLNQANVVRALANADGEEVEVTGREAAEITRIAKAKVRQTRPDAPNVTPEDIREASRARDAGEALPAMGPSEGYRGLAGPGAGSDPVHDAAQPVMEAVVVAAGDAGVDVREFVVAALLAACEGVTAQEILERSKVASFNGEASAKIATKVGLAKATVQKRKRQVEESTRHECCGAVKPGPHQRWCKRTEA